MNCQEVMEFMHRYLDLDLTDAENNQMMEHLRQCPGCASMFERLKSLSLELENLPKVMPPISLVDAILPKLDQLNLESGAALGFDAVPNDTFPRKEKTGGQAAKSTPWFKRFQSKFPLKTAGGVVAAGIILGIAFVTSQPDDLNNADADKYSTMMDTAGQSNFADGAASSGAMEKAGSASDDAKTKANTQNKENSGFGPANRADELHEEAVSPDNGTDKASLKQERSLHDADTGYSTKSAPSTGKTDSQRGDKEASALKPEEQASGSGTSAEEAPAPVENADPNKDAGKADAGKTNPHTGSDAGEEAAHPSLTVPNMPSITATDEKGHIVGSYVSNNAEFNAVVFQSEGMYYIEIQDEAGQSLFDLPQKTDRIESIQWADDNSKLDYDTVDSKGNTTASYTVLMDEQSETIQEDKVPSNSADQGSQP